MKALPTTVSNRRSHRAAVSLVGSHRSHRSRRRPHRAAPSWAEVRRLREESGRRRHQLREVESERDRLRDRVEAADRSEVERMVGDRLVDPADFWSNGTHLAALKNDDGEIDREKVDDAVESSDPGKPHYAKPQTDFHGGARQPLHRSRASARCSSAARRLD